MKATTCKKKNPRKIYTYKKADMQNLRADINSKLTKRMKSTTSIHSAQKRKAARIVNKPMNQTDKKKKTATA
jgi:hypothetical protein